MKLRTFYICDILTTGRGRTPKLAHLPSVGGVTNPSGLAELRFRKDDIPGGFCYSRGQDACFGRTLAESLAIRPPFRVVFLFQEGKWKRN